MPEFSHDDRNVLETESRLWIVLEIIESITNYGGEEKAIGELKSKVAEIAGRLRAYNDQFETND